MLRDPAIRAYIIDSYSPQDLPAQLAGRWIAEAAWPGPGCEINRLYLTPGGLSQKPGEDEGLSIKSPETTGRDGGEFCIIWLGPEFAGDQARDDAGSLTFDSAPLGTGVDITGAAELELEFSVDRPVAKLAVRLCDVRPDGSVTRISYALQNLTHIASHEHPEPLEPGERYFARVRLDDIAWHLPPGHRLRLSLSTSYWPIMWPAPEAVTLTVHASRSWLNVPLRSPEATSVVPHFDEPLSAAPVKLHEVRPPHHERVQTQDPGTGAVTISIIDDFGLYTEATHGLTSGGVGRETHYIEPGDPLSARSTTHWTEEMIRGEHHVRTETFSSMSASATTFYLTARIEAWLNGKLVFERDFAEEIARDLN